MKGFHDKSFFHSQKETNILVVIKLIPFKGDLRRFKSVPKVVQHLPQSLNLSD